MPGGPAMIQPWCMRPERCASAKVRSAASWPNRRRVSRGCGKPSRRSASGSSSISWTAGARAILADSEQPRLDGGPHGGRYFLGSLLAVDDRAAFRLGRRDSQEALAQPIMIQEVPGFVPVRQQRLGATVSCRAWSAFRPPGLSLSTIAPAHQGPRQADLDWNVDDEGQIRLRRRHDKRIERIDRRQVDRACLALIDARRIREAVAHDPAPLGEGGPDDLVEMIGAGGIKEQRLGQWRMGLDRRVEQNLA